MTTAQNVCENALSAILNDDSTATPNASDLSLALTTLSTLLDHWQLDPKATIGLNELIYTPTSGTQSVTIGAAGTIVAPMPVRIEQGSFVRLGGVDIPIGFAASYADYTAMPYKANSGYPTKCWYNQDSVTGLGTLFLYPASNGAELHLLVREVPLGGFAAMTLSTTLTLPMGLLKTLNDNLAAELLEDFNVPEPSYSQVKRKALLSLKKWKRSNLTIGTLNMPPAVGGNVSSQFTS